MASVDFDHHGDPHQNGLGAKLIAAMIAAFGLEIVMAIIMAGFATLWLEGTSFGRTALADFGPLAAFVFSPIRDAYLSDVFGFLVGVVVVLCPTGTWFLAFISSPHRADNPFHLAPEFTPILKIAIAMTVGLAILDGTMFFALMAPPALPPGYPPPGFFAFAKPALVAVILVAVLQIFAVLAAAAYAAAARKLSNS